MLLNWVNQSYLRSPSLTSMASPSLLPPIKVLFNIDN